jgi:uncharacterized Zn-binding protein involved in type VI secretion
VATKSGKVYINGREAVHKGCGGMAIAFPDVCLCPPGPPAGPVPVPLTNTVQAKDMVGGALSVVIQGYPAGHKGSRFARSTGNEVAANTGGGITSHVVQGEARFASGSPDVVIEGNPAARHGDIVRQNAGNCPPSVWMGTVCPGSKPVGPPKKYTKVLQEGTESVTIKAINQQGDPLARRRYRLTTPSGTIVEGRTLKGGIVTIKGIAKGDCKVEWLDESPDTLEKK